MRRHLRHARALAGVAVLGALLAHVGAEPFVSGLRRLDGWTLLLGAAIALGTTVLGAWRWTLVARGLGLDLPLPTAVAESYLSQFLNVTLPGGVLGDVHRGVRQGHCAGDLGRGLRSVVWERAAGQAVLVALTAVAVLVLPTPVPRVLAVATLLVLALLLGLAALRREHGDGRRGPGTTRERRSGASSWLGRMAGVAAADVRAGLLGRHTASVAAASALVVTGHVATFVVAARVAGADASVQRLVPLALVVLVAMGVPLNVAGWGPREGAAAWAFAAAGLGASTGVATAVVYGVVVLVASLPGALLLALTWRGPTRALRPPAAAAALVVEGAARG